MLPAHYFVTDIEADGPSPTDNSMLSFACIAVSENGELVGEFETVMEPRDDRVPDKQTIEWWKSQPDAWSATTTNPKPPSEEIGRFVKWVESFNGKRSFAARPLIFDGMWIDRYLRDYADVYLLDVPHWGRNIFTAGALDIETYMMGVFNRTNPPEDGTVFPDEWLGNHEHTHRAIDDARGYATLLSKLLLIAKAESPHPDDFLS